MTRDDLVGAGSIGIVVTGALAAIGTDTLTVGQLAQLLGSIGVPGAIVLLGWMYRPTVERAIDRFCSHLDTPKEQ